MTRQVRTIGAAAGLAVIMAAVPVAAQEFAGLQLQGSLGEGGFDRYVPPLSNPIFNETPLITTEIRPIYFHQDIPNDFLTGGGNIDVVAAQVRIAITDRLGFLATTDGYAFTEFDNVLPDEEGFADIAVGLKYALYYNPPEGEIFTVGARYTIPIGDLDVAGIELTGFGDGAFHLYGGGMKIFDNGLQLQGNVGIQQAISAKNTSFFYASAHASYELFQNFYPLVEFNAFLPYDGGNQVPNSKLTGFDVADFGSSDPRDTITVAGGARFRATENVILGGGFEYNLNENSDSVFKWRAMFDAVIHF